jgi:hypothetical protein
MAAMCRFCIDDYSSCMIPLYAVYISTIFANIFQPSVLS